MEGEEDRFLSGKRKEWSLRRRRAVSCNIFGRVSQMDTDTENKMEKREGGKKAS